MGRWPVAFWLPLGPFWCRAWGLLGGAWAKLAHLGPSWGHLGANGPVNVHPPPFFCGLRYPIVVSVPCLGRCLSVLSCPALLFWVCLAGLSWALGLYTTMFVLIPFIACPENGVRVPSALLA